MTIALPAKPPKRERESALYMRIMRRLNAMPGVRVTRNANLGPIVPWRLRHDPMARPIIAGLGPGSADLVGVVSVLGWTCPDWPMRVARAGPDTDPMITEMRVIGRLFALECKGTRGYRYREGQQRAWARVVRSLGGFCCQVRSVEEAAAAVERCRRGLSE